MRPLNADVHDPEPLTNRSHHRRIAHCLVHGSSSQIPDGIHHPHHHVERMSWLDHRPRVVLRARPLSLRLPTRTLALPAPPKQLLLHMPLALSLRPRRFHLPSITIISSHVN